MYCMGRDMKTSHAGSCITQTERDANVRSMSEALDGYKVAPREKSEVLPLLEKMMNEVVEGDSAWPRS